MFYMYIREVIPLYICQINYLLIIHIIYHIRNLIFESKVNFVQSLQLSTNLNYYFYCFNVALLLHNDCAIFF